MILLVLEASLRAVVVALVIGLLLSVVRARSGALRHAAWTAVLLTMLLSPLAASWRPRLPVEVPRIPGIHSVIDSIDSMDSRDAAVPSRGRQPGSATSVRTGSSSTATPATFLAANTLRQPSRSWPASSILLALWTAGFTLMLVHLAAGWIGAYRLSRAAARVRDPHPGIPDGLRVYESALLATPITVGVVRPRIVLPTSWPGWAPEVLRAVITHEATHVRRADTFVSCLARINGCIFWFHPLAWWLERALAASAEEACDDIVVRQTGQTRTYAKVLVEMADAIRLRGRRVNWQAVGIGGRGRLEARVDRVLSGEGLQPRPRLRTALLVLGCTAAVVGGLGCQQTPAALQPDPQLTESLALRATQARRWEAVAGMTADEVATLEARAAANPDEFGATEELLVFYRVSGQKVLGWDDMIARRRPHMLRAIERRPESDMAMRAIMPAHDPEGYARGRALWLSHTAKPDVSARVLGNAAAFFQIGDKPLAEQLLIRARDIDPEGPLPRVTNFMYYSPWAERLGELYAQVLVGSNDDTVFNAVKGFSPEEARGPYAASVRAKLDATEDVEELLATASYLQQNARATHGKLDFDPVALGRSYLERAAALAPDSSKARMLLMRDRVNTRQERVIRLFSRSKASPDSMDTSITSLSELERFELLAHEATLTFMVAEDIEWSNAARFEASLGRARRYAEEALALSEKFRSHEDYGTVIYHAHIALGSLALREGSKAGSATPARSGTNARFEGTRVAPRHVPPPARESTARGGRARVGSRVPVAAGGDQSAGAGTVARRRAGDSGGPDALELPAHDRSFTAALSPWAGPCTSYGVSVKGRAASSDRHSIVIPPPRTSPYTDGYT